MSVQRKINDFLFRDKEIEPNVVFTNEELWEIELQDIWYTEQATEKADA